MSFTLDLDKSTEESMKELMQDKLESCRQSLNKLEDPHAAVHQVRKNLKKLRALSRLVRDETGKKAYRRANYFFRDTACMLSEPRDVVAMLETVQSLEAEIEDKAMQGSLQKIKNHLIGRKSAITRITFHQEHLLEQVLEHIKDVGSVYEPWSFRHTGFRALKPGLSRVYSRSRNSMKQAYRKDSPEAFHEWRKRVKYLRYQLDVLQAAWPPMLSVWEKELHELTDILGMEHDLTVLKENIQHMGWEDGLDPASLIGYIKKKRKKLRKEARPLGQKLFYLKTAEFTGLVENSWKVQTGKNSRKSKAEAMA